MLKRSKFTFVNLFAWFPWWGVVEAPRQGGAPGPNRRNSLCGNDLRQQKKCLTE